MKVWVMDVARFGLHAELRKVWITEGVQPDVKSQTRYNWDYLYGALDVVEGSAVSKHFTKAFDSMSSLLMREMPVAVVASDGKETDTRLRCMPKHHVEAACPLADFCSAIFSG